MRAPAASRMCAAALTAALALAVPAAASPTSAACPPPVPVMEEHADDRHVVVLATGTADTVQAGWGDVARSLGVRKHRWRRDPPVYGQVARAARVAGPGAGDLPTGPVVLVPWFPGCGGTYPWSSGFVWLRPDLPDVVVGRLRPREHWAGGVPTVDVSRPDLVRHSGMLPGAARWTFTPDELFGFYATLPSRGQIAADPWRAVAPMRAWLAANPEGARHHTMRYVARGVYWSAASAEVRAGPSPLAGTYRIEVARTGGPVHVAYARTELVPRQALFPTDTVPVVFPERASGYALRAEFRRDLSHLPTPRPGALTRLWRRLAGSSAYDHMEVWETGESSADGVRRFRGHLGLWNVTRLLFADDPVLRSWIGTWSSRETRNMHVQNPVGEIVLREDGRVEWTQVMELASGQAVTLRATRISDVALAVPADR